MRTTLDLDPAVVVAARALARSEGISLGAAVSRLARRGMQPAPVATRSGFPTFDVDADAMPITLETVNAYRDDD